MSWVPNFNFMWNPLLPMSPTPKSWHNNSFLDSAVCIMHTHKDVRAIISHWLTTLLYKIIYIYFTVGGTYITVRGCAPFDSITFNRGMQRQMVGTYWKGFNIFSLCDYDQCNGARNLGGLSLFSSMILLLVHKLF